MFERELASVMSVRDSSSGDSSHEYLSKKVSINGQTVTLYSSNGQTWFSSPEEIPEVMARLDNTRVLLNDAKGEAPAIAPKATSAKYRMRGPKPRPILQQEGGPITGVPVEPISSSAVEVKSGGESLEVVSKPFKESSQTSTPSRKAEPVRQHKKLVAPVSTGPKPIKAPVVKAAAATAKTKDSSVKKVAAVKGSQEPKVQAASTSQKESKTPKAKGVIKKAATPKAPAKKLGIRKPAVKKTTAVKKKR